MTIQIKLVGEIPYDVAPDDAFQATADISSWLGTDNISSVAFTAKDENGVVTTDDCLDSEKNTYTSTVIKPYIIGGNHGRDYVVKCAVTTEAGDVKSFYIKYRCRETET